MVFAVLVLLFARVLQPITILSSLLLPWRRGGCAHDHRQLPISLAPCSAS